MNHSAIKQRFLRDSVGVQIGGIAANLARVGSFSRNEKNRDVVFGLLDESKFFVEWCAPGADIVKAARLVELQLQLTSWQFSLDEIWLDKQLRHDISEASLRWSDEVLNMSGLLDEAS